MRYWRRDWFRKGVKMNVVFKFGNIIILKDDAYNRIYVYYGSPIYNNPLFSFKIPF